MRKIATFLLALFIGTLFFPSCAKKPVLIGRENPEVEIEKCTKLSKKKRFKEAVECLEVFKSHFPKSEWGVEAELYIGDNYFRHKEYLLAADSYQSFIKLHPTHPKVDYAYYKTGLSYLKQTPKAIDRDQEYLAAAITNFDIVKRNFRDSVYTNVNNEQLAEAKLREAKREFYIGRFYYKTGEYLAAIPRFKNVYKDYKDSGLADKALYFVILSDLKLKKLDDAKEAFSALSVDFPNSKYVKEVQDRLIKASEKSLKKKGLKKYEERDPRAC